MHENSINRHRGRGALRALAVAVLLAAALAVGVRAMAPVTAGAMARGFGPRSGDLVLVDLVIAAAHLVGLVAVLMIGIGSVATALSAAGIGSSHPGLARCVRLTPTWLSRLVLVACGAALTIPLTTGVGQGAVVGRDHAPEDPRIDAELSGLILPDLPTAPRAGSTDPAPHARTVRVRPGDSLWSITSDVLGPGATPAQIAHRVDELHLRNLRQIGTDPDLILPGTELTLWRNR